MKIPLKQGPAFDDAPPRILFGNTEEDRKKHYKKQFNLLIEHWDEIPWRQWGVGSARTLSELLREIGDGETVLDVVDRHLARLVDIVIVFVFTKDGKWLVEDPQTMVDGRIRNRRFPYISEKLRIGETPADAAVRALREESGGYILATKNKLIEGSSVALTNDHLYNTGSGSYPGLRSIKKTYTFAYIISEKEYKSKYTEVDISGSITTHSWKSMTEHYWFTNTPLEAKISDKIDLVTN